MVFLKMKSIFFGSNYTGEKKSHFFKGNKILSASQGITIKKVAQMSFWNKEAICKRFFFFFFAFKI